MKLMIKKFDELTLNELYEILKARSAVFVVEQTCPYQDMDGKDKGAYHMWLEDEEGIAAYVRVLDTGVSYEDAASIGRVISLRRHRGYASILLKEGIRLAREKYGAADIKIGAQKYARSLYEKAGFEQCGEDYLEDGIVHIPMKLK
jgi:ElaA protein